MWKNIYRVSRRPANFWWGDMWRLNRQMDHLFGGTRGPIHSEYPLLQAWSGDEGLIIVANMPGVDEDSLDITIEGRTLTLAGSRSGQNYPASMLTYRHERPSGEFNRSIELPYEVDDEAINASYKDGMLRIELPRVPEDQPRKINVNGS